MFGLFTEAKLNVWAHKPSPSADWLESLVEQKRTEQLPHTLQELSLLSEEASFRLLEALLNLTQPLVQQLINNMM